MKGKKERVEQESSSSSESSCSEDESKAKAKKESKKVNLFADYLLMIFFYCLLVVYVCLYSVSCSCFLKPFVSVCVCMLVCAVCGSDWPILSSVHVLLLQRCLS